MSPLLLICSNKQQRRIGNRYRPIDEWRIQKFRHGIQLRVDDETERVNTEFPTEIEALWDFRLMLQKL